MEAARDGDIYTLKYLIENKLIDINTHGPNDYKWVS